MFGTGTRLVVAGAVAATSLVGVAAPAEAKAKRCVLGTWVLTSFTAVSKGPGYKHTMDGLEGTVLRIKKNSIMYNFTGSKRGDISGKANGHPYQIWHLLSGKLTVKAKVTGSTKGKVNVKPRTATGGATRTEIYIASGQKIRTGPFNMVKEHKTGTWEATTPFYSSYTCKGKRLRMDSKTGANGSSTKVTRIFKRL
ncbi:MULTISPECIES: hypothetical protein [Thermomonospora]|uniref:Lipocalin-like domain-containing protein n=1 Tax=Thermomonospora curvata (strain ATCC 19995 / DSM 43183 / JCM 3096 / KCTC 9072 / NBRC 15933 / NCIMB 10081 / Henssen B9) TaxID=471852 RepID=D1A4R7_THECD|nr:MULTISPECIES: hypothetical protein [Thermomonospora]ACY98086.1 hypothetical protein Tcur_2525 [Thermomonospora curvata DSM 43183]PKK14355.1 MAG: hypothetical protein BUE48_012355 [Thermomonospora sp. CIF 1]